MSAGTTVFITQAIPLGRTRTVTSGMSAALMMLLSPPATESDLLKLKMLLWSCLMFWSAEFLPHPMR